ncbi:UNVERIFIED_CONTAM: hypothetical protein Slati_2966600 [Sesamum latifolium]|uniref:Uncharacterized protein n=1 Tax=Sesamum latifolium TaxID=2727402 RepID=A0AAW2VFG5_9LAMI
MKNPNNAANKQRPLKHQATRKLCRLLGTSLASAGGGSTPIPPPPGAVGPMIDLPRRSTSSDTSTDELSPAMLVPFRG